MYGCVWSVRKGEGLVGRGGVGAAKIHVDRPRGGVGGKGRVSRPKKTFSWWGGRG